MRDFLKHWKADENNKLFILKDCCSSLPGFESKAEAFLQEMQDLGVSLVNSTEAFAWPDPERPDGGILESQEPLNAVIHDNKSHDVEVNGNAPIPASESVDIVADDFSHREQLQADMPAQAIDDEVKP